MCYERERACNCSHGAKMKRVAIFGGAFSPPHIGHAMIASWILWADQADQVLMVPTCVHPFGKKMAPFELRLSWCRALVKDLGNPLIGVSPIEKYLPAPNFSLQLLRFFKDEQSCIRFVMGADNLVLKNKWQGFEEIISEFNPIFINRSGVQLPEGTEIPSPIFPDFSSTEVRRRLVEGLSVNHLLTPSVKALIGDTFNV